MAGLSNADPSQHSVVDTPPLPISKEMQGSDSAPPLSPQWLLPKLGDNKLGLATGDLDSHAGKHTDPAKALGNVEDHNVVEKRKDIYRPSFYDMDKGRRDRWGDEERESIPAIRRDLRREGEEVGDFRKVERSSNTASRYSGEARRFSTDRWTESGSRESAYEPRRESKWNTRWGPDDKELENRREKWPGKVGEISNDKGAHHLTIHAKDVNSQGKDADKDGEHHNRSWRSSHALNRGKGETSAYLQSTTNKPALMFGYGRGKGDSGGAVLSADRGRAGSIASNVSRGSMSHFPSDTTSDKFNSSQKDPPILKYNRMKLLDIFRTTNLEGYRMSFEGFQEFTSFMQADLLMPQALTLPTAEELVIMEAIDKGDILSSGTPLASKDGSGGKNSVESGLLQTKSGIGEDVGPVVTDHRDVRASQGKKDHSCNMEGTLYDKSFQDFDSKVVSGEVSSFLDVLTSEAFKYEGPPNKAYDSVKGEMSKMENIIPLRSQMEGVGGSLRSLALTEDRSGTSDMGWLNTRKDMVNDMKNMRADSLPNLGGDAQWQDSTNLQLESRIRRQPSETFNGQGDSSLHRDKLMDRKQQYPSLEHLLLLYKDPQGQIQGPFSGSNLIEWFDAGYFGVDLLVRLASAPPDTPFSLLGDVIPQLRTRVRPPPGFGAVRQSNIVEVPGRGKVGVPGGIHAGVSDFELIKSGQLLKNDSAVEAENRFLESLMSARISSSLTDSYLLPEVMQGYNALAGGRPSIGIENTTDVKYLPHKTPLEQLNHALYQPARESPAMLSNSDSTGEFTIPKIVVPQIVEAPHHIPQSLQQMDLLSALQSATDKTPPPINSGLPLWPNLSEAQALKNTHGSMDLMKDTFELHPNQQISQTGFGVPPHMLQPQCQPPLSNQTPVGNLSSGVIPPEKLTSSEFNQDAQMVNLLRQQYMLTQQLQSQLPFPSHLNQMELLLLMQRQKLEQQQSQLLMQQQQQQHFLSHALSAHHLHMHSDEQPFRPINTEMHEMAQINRQLHAHDSNDSYDMSCHSSNLNWLGAQEANITASVEHPPLSLPNQILNLTSHSNALKASLLDVGSIQTSSVDQMAFIPNIVSTGQSSLQDAFVPLLDSTDVGTLEVSQALPQTKDTITIMSDARSDTVLSENREAILDSKPSLTDMNDSIKNYPVLTPEQVHDETPALKEVEDSEQCEVKKASEKKLRRHKNSKLRAAAESGKESVKASPGQKSKTISDIREAEKDNHLEPAELQCRATLEAGGGNCDLPLESLETHVGPLSSGALDTKTKVNEIKIKEGESVQSWSNNHAWKPTQVQKTKSLLEIQVEEQRMAQTQSLTAGIPSEIIQTSVSAALSDQKYVLESVQYDRVAHRQDEILHNVSGAKDHGSSEEKCTSSLTLPPQMRTEIEGSVDDGNFIEAKDTRKSRKKAAKNKCAVKASLPSNSVALPVHAGASEQAKAPFQTQQDNILLPSPPSAPSFGDFVFWKGDQPSTAPPPAWFTDSVKLQKPAYLRDIFKEQDKNRKAGLQQSPIPTPTKVQSSKISGGSSSSVLVPGSSPSKVPLPINSKSASLTQTNFLSLGHQKTGMEDDLFWGPLDQGNEGNRSDFPSLANPTSQKVKGTPVKSAYAEGSSKKAFGSKSAEHSNTISPAISRSLSKGKQDTESKYSEAMDFLNWCETEWLRLTGTNDTSFLEFCLKQPTAEAAILLRENLASLDRDHDEFIDKFINCKDFLPPGIIEAAFDRRRSKGGIGAPPNRDAAVISNEACDGKKKGGKKGRKLNPALLGFNVVSNRIMMGEIQAIED